ncbi:hypothetical protein [Acidovorax sp.]|uniref:hypothetical protein n=1 Tax=Acidovorax sp. TaxID=1872122 RepID=UPI002ACD5803|nr:hypothetical protein [Acidovorax sp.]MDZ7863358.1 hypothetical protein [Acidovorax sp.]
MSGIKEEALRRARLDARHELEPLDLQELQAYCRRNVVSADQVREAERQGRDLLASGARCMCPSCEVDLQALDHKERLRIHYAARRHTQLQAQGIDDHAARARTIQAEIDAGAALQSAPIQITRTGGTQ